MKKKLDELNQKYGLDYKSKEVIEALTANHIHPVYKKWLEVCWLVDRVYELLAGEQITQDKARELVAGILETESKQLKISCNPDVIKSLPSDFEKWLKKNKITGYKAETQTGKNIAWFLPRPKPDRYKGGMPLYCEDWLIDLAQDILKMKHTPYTLNAFCGMNKRGIRVDLNPDVKPDIVGDVHKLSEISSSIIGPVGPRFDLIIADPPYSTDEAKEIYGTPPLKYKQWTAECDKFLKAKGLLMVYHKYVMPNPNPEKYVVVKRVFIGNRTMHLPRVCIVFQKKDIY